MTQTNSNILSSAWGRQPVQNSCQNLEAFQLLVADLQGTLSGENLSLLRDRADNRLYREISEALQMSPFSVRKKLNYLLSDISQKYSAKLFVCAWALDLLLDAEDGEYSLKKLSQYLQIKQGEAKFIILISSQFMKYPVQHYQGRVFRVVTTISETP
ncbi:hypothetical protein [Endozoicomonas arenosclerae]|uniref:hypothetical protein n=1 Tax=Endozoicomonas arenosclerae TaxID=1633495 RepID=UPI0007845E76|nr:hypothetical protein [Endozoicomonas arenosclerae]